LKDFPHVLLLCVGGIGISHPACHRVEKVG